MAFPGAEGYGRYAQGGRGGQILFVTNLHDRGPGSLREAIDTEGPRTILFRISGTIELEAPLRLTHPRVTLAGQSAPGDGICLRRYPLVISADHSIVRYLRVRLGDEAGQLMDGIDVSNASQVIVDHCSVSWTLDEAVNTYHGTSDITMQWCMITESLNDSPLRNGHGFAASLGGRRASFHHNLFANHAGRNPSIAGETSNPTVQLDFRNNLIFNWQKRRLDGRPESINVVNNYYRAGPASRELRSVVKIQSLDTGQFGQWYVDGNVLETHEGLVRGNQLITIDSEDTSLASVLVDRPVDEVPVLTQSAEDALESVIQHAGATLPCRDKHDARILEEVRTGKTTYGNGIIASQDDVGGWPKLETALPPVDLDEDGMADEWERRFAEGAYPWLSPHEDLDGDGYTNLEEYLNQTHPYRT